MTIEYKDTMKLELWVWDRGELEGFAVYLDGKLFDEEDTVGMKYPIGAPKPTTAIVVEFGGADGGATKIVDTAAGNTVLEHQDDGIRHGYIIQAAAPAPEPK